MFSNFILTAQVLNNKKNNNIVFLLFGFKAQLKRLLSTTWLEAASFPNCHESSLDSFLPLHTVGRVDVTRFSRLIHICQEEFVLNMLQLKLYKVSCI